MSPTTLLFHEIPVGGEFRAWIIGDHTQTVYVKVSETGASPTRNRAYVYPFRFDAPVVAS